MSWQQVDKLAGETFKKGLFKSEPGNPCYKNVDSISFDGKIRKYPFTHEEWLEYSNKLLIEFDEIWRDEKIHNRRFSPKRISDTARSFPSHTRRIFSTVTKSCLIRRIVI